MAATNTATTTIPSYINTTTTVDAMTTTTRSTHTVTTHTSTNMVNIITVHEDPTFLP